MFGKYDVVRTSDHTHAIYKVIYLSHLPRYVWEPLHGSEQAFHGGSNSRTYLICVQRMACIY